ncbi:aminotransferase class V-fold PLP-dependent enzyme [Vallicoccus soli]|uniref:Aminotransferase class V-fold PLP-dependent enzyme n=1 Tax=Vallicoccus soli TaxID=2339232 RepID=A0A3A3YXS9_9ACTN|nr:aminotransferase class V-fold PLP-dependent enzyme [Vallicoccus soli]RJK96458.1 aminotransferase class V-fold PLP-dependent enzyme [Vallicoccus soli]
MTAPALDAPLAQDLFDVDPGYLDAATMGVPPRPAAAALREAVDAWVVGRASAAGYDPFVQRSRAEYAALVGVDASQVAVGSTTSAFAGVVAGSLPDGAEVVCVDGDFTSMVFPFLVQAGRGVTVRHVPLEGLADALDERTHLVAFSLVQSACGRVADLEAVLEAAARTGTRTFVDVTQAAGWMPFDASRVDWSVCSGYKWLCMPRGTAFLTARPGRLDELVPSQAGWYAGEDVWASTYGPGMRLASSARRFDLSPAWLAWVGGAEALAVLRGLGPERVGAHDVALANALREDLGLAPSGSAVLSLPVDGGERRLAEAGVRAASRAGRVRIAFHLWNTLADVEAASRALRG